MVEFGVSDYLAIKGDVYEKLAKKRYFSGHLRGRTTSGVRYRLVCTLIRFSSGRIIPIWWEMFTYDKCGDSVLNDFDFNEILS